MPQRRPPAHQPAKPNVVARKRTATRAPDAAAREEWQPGQTARAGASSKNLLSLQRRFGNRAVQGLIQPKLTVGPADDVYERQADQAAGQVTAARPAAALPAGGLLRASAAATRAGTRAASGIVQRRSALVSAKTTSRKFKGPRTANLDKDVAAVEQAPKGASYSRLEVIELHDAKQSHVTDKAGAIGWFRIESGKGAGEFIRGSKVIGGLEPGEAAPEEKEGQGQEMSGVDVSGNLVGGADAALVDIIRGATNEQDADKTKSLSAITNSADAQKGLAYAESGTWIGAGILGMAASLRDLTDKDKSGFDKLLASIGLLSGAAGVAGGVSQIVATATSDASATTQSATQQQAAATSGFMVGYGEMFGAITNGLKTIKGIVDLVKMVSQGKTDDVGEYVKAGTDILSNGLQTAGSVLRTVRGFNEVLTHGGTATSQFGSVLPGLDIAIAAVGIIQNGYYLVVSAIEMRKMYARKQELEEKLQTHHGLEKEHIKVAGKRYRTEGAQDATTDQLIARATAKYNKLSVKKFGAKNDEERAKLAEQQVEVRTELDLLKKQKAEQDANKGSGAFGDYSGQTADVLRERELASNTHIANKRRVSRQSVHIGAKLLQIGAAIATFVSGPGAPAAMALKLSALGIDGSLPFWRWIKEKGRNQAAANRAKGGTGWTNKVFNADKSTAAKSRSRHKDAVLILQMVGNLSKLVPGRSDDKEKRLDKLRLVRPQAKRVEGYIKAAGCSPEKLYAANGNPPEQVKILVAELSRREL